MVLRVFPRGRRDSFLGGGWHAVCIGRPCAHGLAVRVQCLLPGVAVQPDQQLPAPFGSGCGGRFGYVFVGYLVPVEHPTFFRMGGMVPWPVWLYGAAVSVYLAL